MCRQSDHAGGTASVPSGDRSERQDLLVDIHLGPAGLYYIRSSDGRSFPLLVIEILTYQAIGDEDIDAEVCRLFIPKIKGKEALITFRNPSILTAVQLTPIF